MTEADVSYERLQEAAKRHLWLHFTRMSAYAEREVPVITRGEGPYVFDHHGKRYLERHHAYIEALRDRRFPIVDTERGIVVCRLFFDHPGDLALADAELPFRSPNSMLVFEAFKGRSGCCERSLRSGRPCPTGSTPAGPCE